MIDIVSNNSLNENEIDENYEDEEDEIKEIILDPKQEQMISALLTHKNASEACHDVNISRSTLARWMKTDEFKQALRDAERVVTRNAIINLTSGTEYALSILKDLMTTSQSESMRRLAANDWLHHFYKVHEMVRDDEVAKSKHKLRFIEREDIPLE